MQGKMKVMFGPENPAIEGQLTNVLESRGLGLTHFRSVKEACHAITQEDVLVVFCQNRLIDGTYEDLLTAVKEVRPRTRVVVASSGSNRPDSSTYLRAKELGAFDVLRESYGPKDVEWVVICAIRDEQSARAATAWLGRR